MTYMLNRPDKLRVLEYVIQDASLRRPELSLTVDTPKDISLMREIYKQFHPHEPMLGDIIKWLDENPSKKIIINPSPVQNIHIDGIDCSFQEDKF